MIAAWMLHALAVGCLVGAGALAVEHLVRAHRRPARWVWVGALLVSVGWPLALWAWSQRPAPPLPVRPGAEMTAVAPAQTPPPPRREPAAIAVAPDSALRSLDGPMALGWALVTAGLALFVGALTLRTRALMRGWRAARVAGRQVLVSDDWGPAVVGFLRPRIVLPRWCLELEPSAQEMVLDHEEEHVRAGDLRLLLMVGGLVILAPWHLPIWWQLSRLRSAVEADCDLRVLRRRAGESRSYIDVLLRVGEAAAARARPHRAAPTLAALLSEPYVSLRRRIRIMTMPDPKRPRLTGGLLTCTALAFVAVACGAPPPNDAGTAADAAVEIAAGESNPNREANAGDEGSQYPTFTPFSVAPNGDNPGEVRTLLEERYAALPDTPTGRVDAWFFVNEEGRVTDTRLARSSGSPELDELALRSAVEWRFTPAMNRDQPRAVWVSLPVVFGEGDTGNPADPTPGPAPRIVSGPALDDAGSAEGVGVITGLVRDAASDRPLAFAQVYVPETGRGTLTDAEGRFRIEGVPTGERSVAVELIGYQTSRVATAVGSDTPTEIEFPMQATALRLQPLVVAGGGGG